MQKINLLNFESEKARDGTRDREAFFRTEIQQTFSFVRIHSKICILCYLKYTTLKITTNKVKQAKKTLSKLFSLS